MTLDELLNELNELKRTGVSGDIVIEMEVDTGDETITSDLRSAVLLEGVGNRITLSDTTYTEDEDEDDENDELDDFGGFGGKDDDLDDEDDDEVVF